MAQKPKIVFEPKMPLNGQPSVVSEQPVAASDNEIAGKHLVITPQNFSALNNVTRFIVRQLIHYDIKEDCGVGSTFNVWTGDGDLVFYVREGVRFYPSLERTESNCCCRWCCGPHRSFRLDIYNTNDDVIAQIHRVGCRCDCCFCCLDCLLCVHKAIITDAYGHTLGIAKQTCSFWNPEVEIKSGHGDVVALFQGPTCPCRCCTDLAFTITDEFNQKTLGNVEKHWGGERVDRVNRDHELYDVRMSPTLNSTDKFLVLATSFFLNYTYFEMS